MEDGDGDAFCFHIQGRQEENNGRRLDLIFIYDHEKIASWLASSRTKIESKGEEKKRENAANIVRIFCYRQTGRQADPCRHNLAIKVEAENTNIFFGWKKKKRRGNMRDPF